jgi:exodeoxyribonuclease VII large subunit
LDPITVSELSGSIKSLLESGFQFVHVTGEISNFKHHTSGHFYFALKDENAQISALMWSSRNRQLNFTPEDGMKVNVKGRVTVYEGRGTYQIDVFDISIAGKGDIYVAFEELKEKLRKEGLFEDSHKKPLPKFPERVILITSETGAALQDFYRVACRRYPVIKLMLINSKMQGSDAAKEIVFALKKACQKEYGADVIVLTRGGGSIEDLWVFNDERIARTIFDATVPVVSAIGHEIDFTITDFVADLRAPTPSAAAEMILPDINELRRNTDETEDNLKYDVLQKLNSLRTTLNSIDQSYHFRKPADRIKDLKVILQTIDESIKYAVSTKFERMGNELTNIEKSYYFKRPADNIRNVKEKLEEIAKSIKSIPILSFKTINSKLDSFNSLLKSANPESVLRRGFVLVSKDNLIIQRNALISEGDKIELKFSDGRSLATINEKINQN